MSILKKESLSKLITTKLMDYAISSSTSCGLLLYEPEVPKEINNLKK